MGRRSLLTHLRPRRGPAVNRRSFLQMSLASVAAACADPTTSSTDSDTATVDPTGTCSSGTSTAASDPTAARPASFTGNPFTLGVASGDPLSDRVILWTRLASVASDVSQTPSDDVDVVWEISNDPQLATLLHTGVATATTALAHTLHVDVDGLEPDAVYWYRFRVGEHLSPIGRTRTVPCADASPRSLRIAFATCQRFSDGYYVAHRDLAEHEVDLVVFLGDYIYESGGSAVRPHESSSEPFDLDAYRNRYGHYRADPHLQASHASAPWAPIWDDHEVDNNHAGTTAPGGDTDAWAARRTAAYRAWYEHMPVRMTPPTADVLPIYRHVQYGDLAQILLLDGRQYRDAQPCGDNIGGSCDEVDDERTFLGSTQETWFTDRLQAVSTEWLVIGNPVVMLPMDFGDAFLNPDQWDGYPLARERLLDALTEHSTSQPVVFTGDIHASGVGYIPTDIDDLESPARVSEFVVPAISSGIADGTVAALGSILGGLPHIHWWDFVAKGWVLVEIDRERLVARYRLADDATDPESVVREARVWEVLRDVPGPTEVLERP
jgi:alkaline phosphatase D